MALGLIETQYIPAEKQLADIFTKSLPRRQYNELRGKLGVGVAPTSSLRGNVSPTHSEAQADNKTEVEASKQVSQRSSGLQKAAGQKRCTEKKTMEL